MKNIRIIKRANDGIALMFKSKRSTGYIKFINGKFIFSHPIETV